MSVCQKFIGNDDDAEDVAQEIFIELWHQHRKFESLDQIKAFLYLSIKNKCLNFRKHQTAEYENTMAGVFDMKLRNGNKEKYEHTFQFGLMGIDFASEGPIGKKQGSSYLINYRYSTTGLLNTLGLISINEVPAYQDLSFKINVSTQKAGTFSLWGIGGLDKDLGPDEETDSSKWKYTNDRIHFAISQQMGACGLTNRYIAGERTYVRSTIAVSGTGDNQNFTRLDDSLRTRPQTYFDDRAGKITFSSVLNHKFNAHNTLADPANKDVIYDETKAFQKQYPSTIYLDVTITYRINKPRHSGMWALQIKNPLRTPSRNEFLYN